MKQKVLVWDLPTRIFHWSLVVLLPFMWFSADKGGDWLVWHLRAGLLVLGLLIFRVMWGFVGSDTSRFAQFIRGPQAVKAYMQGRVLENQQPGHNPLGALMVVGLLSALSVQVLTGLFSTDENTFTTHGYLSGLVGSASSAFRSFHIQFFWALIALIAVHILVVVAYKLIKKKDFITPMITGFKSLEAPLPVLRFTSWRIAIMAILAVVVVLVVVANIA